MALCQYQKWQRVPVQVLHMCYVLRVKLITEKEDSRSATGIPQTTGAHEREYNEQKEEKNVPQRHKKIQVQALRWI